jgi:hypothetical protein
MDAHLKREGKQLGFDGWPVTGTPRETDGGCVRQPLV